MKKNSFKSIQNDLVSFLKFLKTGTSIPINSSSLTSPYKLIDGKGRSVCVNLLVIGERPLPLIITSHISNKGTRVIGFELICCFDNLIPDALTIQREIKSCLPFIPLIIRSSFDEIWGGEYLRLTREKLSK